MEAGKILRHYLVDTLKNTPPFSSRPRHSQQLPVPPFKFQRLCPRKWLMLFSLKFQRNNQKNASAMDSAKGKTGEKGCLFTVLWRWNNHTLWQSHSKRMANKLLSHAIRQQKTHKNVISIYYKKIRTIEHGWRFFPWLCHRKRLMLYFLKFQRSNQ